MSVSHLSHPIAWTWAGDTLTGVASSRALYGPDRVGLRRAVLVALTRNILCIATFRHQMTTVILSGACGAACCPLHWRYQEQRLIVQHSFVRNLDQGFRSQ